MLQEAGVPAIASFMLDVYSKLIAADEQLAEGKVLNADVSLKSIREKAHSRVTEVTQVIKNPVDATAGYFFCYWTLWRLSVTLVT